jgi:hypothetical protein
MSSEGVDGRKFWGAEGAGEAKYEVSHVVGKGSYGVVWCAAAALRPSLVPALPWCPGLTPLQRRAEPPDRGEGGDQAHRPRAG